MLKSQAFPLAAILVLLATACAPLTATPAPIMTQEPILSAAVVQSVDVQILESFPVQVHAVVRGELPDAACTKIDSITQTRDGNTFNVTLTTITDPLARCAQVLTPFEEVVSLDVDSLPPGTYIVNVNGVSTSFDLGAVSAGPTVITLERTACFGTCPIYILTIFDDGRVEYEGRDFVKIKGKRTGSITPEEFQQLVDAFQNADYFNLQDLYTAPVTDLPTTITSFTFNGRTKTVRNYGGCFHDTLAPAPQALCDLEIMIDTVTNSAQWVGNP